MIYVRIECKPADTFRERGFCTVDDADVTGVFGVVYEVSACVYHDISAVKVALAYDFHAVVCGVKDVVRDSAEPEGGKVP